MLGGLPRGYRDGMLRLLEDGEQPEPDLTDWEFLEPPPIDGQLRTITHESPAD